MRARRDDRRTPWTPATARSTTVLALLVLKYLLLLLHARAPCTVCSVFFWLFSLLPHKVLLSFLLLTLEV
jgi:hypothetical protein